MAINKAILVGNLGKDPELRYTASGQAVATFSLATTEKFKNKGGEQQERTEWHNIVVWNRQADLCKRFLAKGRQVYVEGKLRTREWSDRDGNKRRITEVIASQIVFLGSRPQGADAGVQPMETSSPSTAEPDQAFGDAGITDSDIPF